MNVFDNKEEQKGYKEEQKEQSFARFLSFGDFLSERGIDKKNVIVVKTTNGYQMLQAAGKVIANIKKSLKGETVQETSALILATVISGKGATFGIPKEGSTDIAGRPSLPCLMESAGNWESEAIFK